MATRREDRRVGSALLRLMVVLAFCLPASACGGVLGEDNGPPPDPTAAEIVKARATAVEAADEALEHARGALGGAIVARASEDGCYRDPCPETLSGNVEAYWNLRTREYGTSEPPITSLPTTVMYERGNQHLDVAYVRADRVGRATLEYFHRRALGGHFTSYERAKPFDVDATLERASGFEYAVALAVETDYFEDADIG
jgi:hypothetical protein